MGHIQELFEAVFLRVYLASSEAEDLVDTLPQMPLNVVNDGIKTRYAAPNRSRLVFMVTFNMRAVTPSGKDVLKLSCTFKVTYRTNRSPNQEEGEAMHQSVLQVAFGELREFIKYFAMRSGVPPLTLDVARFAQPGA